MAVKIILKQKSYRALRDFVNKSQNPELQMLMVDYLLELKENYELIETMTNTQIHV